MTKETNNNEAQTTEKMQNVKDWLLAGVFSVTLWAVLAALFYFLDDLKAGLVVLLLFIAVSFVLLLFATVSAVVVPGFFLEKKRKNNRAKQH